MEPEETLVRMKQWLKFMVFDLGQAMEKEAHRPGEPQGYVELMAGKAAYERALAKLLELLEAADR